MVGKNRGYNYKISDGSIGDNSHLRAIAKKQGVRISQLTTIVELLVRQLSRMN